MLYSFQFRMTQCPLYFSLHLVVLLTSVMVGVRVGRVSQEQLLPALSRVRCGKADKRSECSL